MFGVGVARRPSIMLEWQYDLVGRRDSPRATTDTGTAEEVCVEPATRTPSPDRHVEGESML